MMMLLIFQVLHLGNLIPFSTSCNLQELIIEFVLVANTVIFLQTGYKPRIIL